MLRQFLNSPRVGKIARHFSLAFCALLAGPWLGALVEAKVGEIKIAEIRAEQQRQKIAFEEQEITCLTNVIFHEVRGEVKGVRELTGKAVLATISDPTYKARTVCADAETPGRFSGLKNPRSEKFQNSEWTSIWWHMSEVYYGNRLLPRGWQCVRAFRASDDYMEKLSDRAIRQLGITVSAKGMKYFAADNVPVDTRGTVTYYSPRGGCKYPSPTI